MAGPIREYRTGTTLARNPHDARRVTRASGLHLIQGHNSDVAARWLVSAYPECGEASVVFIGNGNGGEWAQRGGEPDREANRKRASGRARARMRRYAVRNKLRYMWVLTFSSPEYDHDEAMRAVGAFMDRLLGYMRRRKWIRGNVAYMYSAEPHPGGHGWHVNLFLDRRVTHADVAKVWGRGHVWVKDWVRDTRLTGSLRERVRAGAAYAAKYASKDLEELAAFGCEMQDGAHRYEVAEGFTPRAVTSYFRYVGSAMTAAMNVMPADAIFGEVWEAPADYGGPPLKVLRWRDWPDG